MRLDRCFQSGVGSLLIVIIVFITLCCNSASAQAPGAPAAQEMSQPQIDDLIHLLEDEQARSAFMQRLKALKQLQAETPSPQPPPQMNLSPALLQALKAPFSRPSRSCRICLAGWHRHRSTYGPYGQR